MQLERNRAGRSSYRLLRGAVAIGIAWESRKCAAMDDAVSAADAATSAGQKKAAYGN